MNPRLSLVVPFFNEQGNILPLVETAVAVLSAMNRDPFEIILVNDGSTDGTAAEIAAACARWPACRAWHHEKNEGQSAALLHGLQAARGEFILTMDGDGQNDPRDLPKLFAPVEADELDLACGWRVERHDSALRRLISRIGNTVRGRVLGDRLHDGGCQLRVMRRAVLVAIFPVDLMQSFLPAMVAAAGFRIGEFPVTHHPRVRGSAHFGLRELWLRPALALFKVRRRLRQTGRQATPR